MVVECCFAVYFNWFRFYFLCGFFAYSPLVWRFVGKNAQFTLCGMPFGAHHAMPYSIVVYTCAKGLYCSNEDFEAWKRKLEKNQKLKTARDASDVIGFVHKIRRVLLLHVILRTLDAQAHSMVLLTVLLGHIACRCMNRSRCLCCAKEMAKRLINRCK